MNERTWRFFEWDEDRWVLEHGDGMSVTVLYSNESNRAFLLRILNAHDALVSALEAAQKRASCPVCGNRWNLPHEEDCLLVPALQMVKGEAS